MFELLYDAISTWRVKQKLTSYGDNIRARNAGWLWLGENSEVHVGNNVLLERKVRISTGKNARIYIDDNSYIGDYSNILAVKEITIGKDCAISWHVCFMDTTSHSIGVKGEKPRTKIEPIRVEDHVWIGIRAVILKGVTVGQGAIIANNAVVTKDVPPFTMVAGNPAKVIKEDVIWE
ncbi:hypothetical protein SYNTR_2277 [Candidatus Syntrophocurvum alkaliphilum]|uniref:Maltose O-acetyltransferase n=1 Tax=Candidatus Syntrophocurvum alkaliphilum TaxID=2293317 RepID=A0A6I6DPI9_9FIRM|nr:acyltransferase [Candidatus Syntrophocurvum alkaliphilum]QGU00871.1 hypothetical protein SYNTR_2277 [Candidatus Syntrophocurvum alkaliphilum]